MNKLQLPKAQHSYWLQGFDTQTYLPLRDNIKVDVAIVGGGIAGLTTAYLLKQSGLKVAVLEKQTIGKGTTGGTTGKVTAQHGLIYAELQEKFGNEVAKYYASSCQAALQKIRDIISREKIACDWRQEDNYVYTTDQRKVAHFKKEAAVAAQLGLPATFETDIALPFPTKGAVKFAEQGTFHVLKYLHSLAALIHGNGSYIFEHSNVTSMRDGSPSSIESNGATVAATHIVIATKVPAAPLVGRALYAAVEYPETSYIVGAKYTVPVQGMYISPDKNQYSLLPIQTDDGPLLLIGGENHIPGLGRSAQRQQKLADYGQKWFGCTEVAYRWKAMDYMAYDKLPLVGTLYPQSKSYHMLGGFKKWGLTLSMVTASTLHDQITGKDATAAKVFSPHRMSAPASIPARIFEHFKQ